MPDFDILRPSALCQCGQFALTDGLILVICLLRMVCLIATITDHFLTDKDFVSPLFALIEIERQNKLSYLSFKIVLPNLAWGCRLSNLHLDCSQPTQMALQSP